MEFLKITGGTCTLLRMVLVGENKDLRLSKDLCVLSAPNTDVVCLANGSKLVLISWLYGPQGS